jgi:hypothetical protein
MISGFCRERDKICVLLGYYAAHGGNSLPTFRDNLSVPFLKGQEFSVRNYQHALRNIPEERKPRTFQSNNLKKKNCH